MYLLKPLPASCTGPTPDKFAAMLAGQNALDASVARAAAAIFQNTARPELNSRGQLLDTLTPGEAALSASVPAVPGTPASYNVTPARYARVLLSDVPVCVRSQPPAPYHSRAAGLSTTLDSYTSAALPSAVKTEGPGIPVSVLAAAALVALWLLKK